MNLNFDILHNIYELRKLININNVYDLFPNKTVEIVNNNLYLLGIQLQGYLKKMRLLLETHAM